MNKKIRRRYHLYGRVQGVGFRWTAMNAAGALGLTGWVKNEYDGSVTMELQGNSEAVTAMLKTLNGDRWVRIDRVEAEDIALNDDEHDFDVRF